MTDSAKKTNKSDLELSKDVSSVTIKTIDLDAFPSRFEGGKIISRTVESTDTGHKIEETRVGMQTERSVALSFEAVRTGQIKPLETTPLDSSAAKNKKGGGCCVIS